MQEIWDALIAEAVGAVKLIVPALVLAAVAWAERLRRKASDAKAAVKHVEDLAPKSRLRGDDKLEAAVDHIRSIAPWYAKQDQDESRTRAQRAVTLMSAPDED